jgi:hypothetical protein
MVGFVVILAVLLWAFSASFAVAMPSNDAFLDETAGPLIGMLTSFTAILGSFHMKDFEEDDESLAFFLMFLFLVVVVMLNLLIAIMSDSYEKVKETEVIEARKLRAETIIVEEKLMSAADRKNPEYFPRFLQVLRTTEGKDDVWAGLGGRIAKEIERVEKNMKQNHDAIKSDFVLIKADLAKQEMLAADIAEMKESQEKLTQMVAKLLESPARHDRGAGALTRSKTSM